MATFTGVGGSVTFATGNVLNVREWSATIEQSVLKHNVFATADDFETAHQSVRRWFGTYTCYLDDTTPPTNFSASVNIAPASATFLSMTARSVAGSIMISSISESVVVDGEAMVSYTWVGSGTPTLA